MDELLTALDELGAEDLHAFSAPELLDRPRALVAARNRLDAELARTVRRAETAQAPQVDGLKTMGSWLRGHCRLSPAAAAQVVRNGRALQVLPAVAAAHAAGAVTADQVAVIGQITTPERLALAAAQDVNLPGLDAALAALAAGHSHADTAKAVHHYLARLDQDGPEPDPTATRSFALATHPDGRVTGRLDLDPVGGEKLRAALESLLQAHRPAGDTRSQAQRHADALVQLCDNALAAGTPARPAHRQAARRPGRRAARPRRPGPRPGGCGAGLRRGGLGRRGPLDRLRRRPDPDRARSRRRPARPGPPAPLQGPAPSVRGVGGSGVLRFAGCQAPTWWCEVHHILEWIYGGPTSLENSRLLCERHHTQVHHGFRVERDEHGRWHTYRPDGTEILLFPTPADDPDLARAG